MSSDATETPPPSLIGGKYELRGLIGRGGMGSVYEGRHVSLGTPVAIKFIDAEYANSDDAKNRFDTEARAAAKIQSKHAIQIFDHGVTMDGRPYIVMELLVGEPLDKRITRLGALPLAETARVIRQVSRALSRAHEKGIVHRDLKPENIFLVRGPDDDEDIAKVLDFGIAKIKAAPGAVGISSSTKTGTLLGTPFFMSPEQARGLRTVDHRSDLWSLGVIVFKCVTGVLPFDGESLGDLLVKICTAPIPVPSHVVPGLPASLDVWMGRALDREPETRFQNASELADSLGSIAGLSLPRPPSSASTPEPGASVPSGPYSPRPPSSRAARGAAGVLDGATDRVPFSGPEYSQPIPAATSAPLTASSPEPPRRPSKLAYVAGAALGILVGFAAVFYWVKASGTNASQGIAVSPPPPVIAPAASAPASATSPTGPGETIPPPPLPPLEPAASVTASSHATRPQAPKAAAKPKQPAVPTVAGTPLPAAPAGTPLPPAPAKPAPNLGEPGY